MKSFDLFLPWMILSLVVDLPRAVVENAMEEGVEFLRRYDADTVNCQNVSEITFLGYFPCLRPDSSFNASESIKECDLLAEAAAHLAVERVNGDPNILSNITLKLYPIYVPRQREAKACGDYHDLLEQIFNLLYSNYSRDIWGMVGPGDDPSVANFIAPVSRKSGLITVSYGATSIEDNTETVSTFYRTLPSDRVENYGRLVLLVKHEWFRIGILTSVKDTHYLKQSSHFVSIFNRYIEKDRLELDVIGTFEDSPTPALTMIKSRDINIIIGFFGPDNARRVMCQAKTEGLISSDHAWVLPSYYDPNWWKSPNNADCSDDEMRDILESVIFVDTSKFPPVGTTLDEFYSELLAVAKELYPSLTEDDLKPYLLHSRATSAYDAVTLLARSVGAAFEHGGDSCTDTNVIQVAMDKAFLACEYCRIYSPFLNCSNLTMSASFEGCDGCSNLTNPNFRFTPGLHLYLHDRRNNTKPQYLLDVYGQILYSQFQGGEECPVVLYWPGLSENYEKGYIPIGSHDDETMCVSRRLNLSQRNFVSEESKCSRNFNWSGSPHPPSSRHIEVYYIPEEGLIAIGISVLIGLGAVIFLINFNILCRANRIVKATSPWINIVLLFAIIMRLPSTLLYCLSLSVGHYPSLMAVTDWTPLCHLNLWMYYIGDVLFVATLIAKNWRIYRIFYNKKLEHRGDMSNSILILGIALTIFPVIIILIVWSAIGVEFLMHSIQNENLQVVKFTTCFRPNSSYFELVTNFYVFVLIVFLFVLSLLTASVPTSNFRREGVVTYKAVVIILLPTPMVFLSRIVCLVTGEVELVEVLVWVEFSWTALLPLLLLAVLFAPTIRAVFRSYVDGIQATSEERENRKLSMRYNDLKSKADELRLQLEELDNDILRVKADLKVSQITAGSLRSFTSNKTRNHPDINVPETTDLSDIPDTVELTVALSSGNEMNLTSRSPNHVMSQKNSLLVVDGNNKANNSDDGMPVSLTLPGSNGGIAPHGLSLSTFSSRNSTFMESDCLQDDGNGDVRGRI